MFLEGGNLLSHEEPGSALGQAILLLAMLVNIVSGWLRDRRNRRWSLEDDERKRKEMAEHEQRMKAELNAKTAEIKASVAMRLERFGKRLNGLLEEDMSDTET